MADRGDDRGADRVDGADQALVGERQQVLDGAAAAGDHDDVDVGVAVEPLDGLDHLERRALALHGGVRRLDPDRRPAAARVVDARRARRPSPGAVTSPTQPGRKGSRRLQGRVEEPLGGEQLAAALEPGEQLAEADHADRRRRPGTGCRCRRRSVGRAWITMLAPSTSGGLSESKRVRAQVTWTDTSATGSRSADEDGARGPAGG